MFGYNGKLLEVNLSNSSFKDVTVPDEWLRDYIGGRALAAKNLVRTSLVQVGNC